MVPPSIITRTPRLLWFARLAAVLGVLVGGLMVGRFLNLATTDLRGQTAAIVMTLLFLAAYVAWIVWLIERILLKAVERAHADRIVARHALLVEMVDEPHHRLASIIWEASRVDEGTISATGANVVADAILRERRLSLEQQLDDMQAADGL